MVAVSLKNPPVGVYDIAKKLIFQAEGGIRDVERSRGLGDVYKRQILALSFVKMKYISGYSFQKRLKEKKYIKMNYGMQRDFNKFSKNKNVNVVY